MVSKLEDRMGMIKQDTTNDEILSVHCDIDFDKEISCKINFPSEYALKNICTEDKAHIFKYNNNLYMTAEVYLLLFGGYSPGAFYPGRAAIIGVYYPNVMYKLLNGKNGNRTVPFIILDKDIFLKLKEEFKRLNEEAFDEFYDKYITSNIVDDTTDNDVDDDTGHITLKTRKPTIANLNEMINELKLKYKEFISEDAIKHIVGYIAENILIFQEYDENALNREIKRLKAENERIISNNKQFNYELKKSICKISEIVTPIVNNMDINEVLKISFGSDYQEKTKVEPEYATGLFDNDNYFQVTKRKTDQKIVIDCNTLRNFIYNLQEAIFGSNISKELHKQYNQSAYICVCNKAHLGYKKDLNSGGIEAFQNNNLLFTLANFYTYDIRPDTKECPYIKLDNGETRFFHEIITENYLDIYRNNIINLILKPLGYDITEENISEVFDYIYTKSKFELGEGI